MFVVLNFIVDILYTLIDPRIELRVMNMEEKVTIEKQDGGKAFLKSEFFYHYKHNIPAIIGSILVVVAILVAVFGRFIAPQNPYDLTAISLADSYLPPVWLDGGKAGFLLGSDEQGRDILSAIIYGSAKFHYDRSGRHDLLLCHWHHTGTVSRIFWRQSRCCYHAYCRCTAVFPIYADRIIHHVRIWTRRWKTAHRPDYGRLGNLCKNSPR